MGRLLSDDNLALISVVLISSGLGDLCINFVEEKL